MILVGADLKDQSSADSQGCLSVSQTILFNCKKRALTGKSRHSLDYKPPLPLYMGLSVHMQTRSKKLIGQLYELGISVSFDRVVEMENQLATATCENIAKNGVVCPAQLRKGLFTVSALDNLDHNPSRTTAKGSFHGTGISLFQFPSKSNVGHFQDGIDIPSPETKNHRLSDNFTTVPAVALKKANVAVPQTPNQIKAF
ncbi:putative translation initiation factor IF-2 [Dissostichus eleginoides]|uniref:Translation initiation factor IF-2 n=1 Tax=Dissostichus eleginoides TaxID=100907 RepID=A0AAD9BZM9_DISEL|nr:putative translation initiation factor IF-2 [Dissostichus eleginoides]